MRALQVHTPSARHHAEFVRTNLVFRQNTDESQVDRHSVVTRAGVASIASQIRPFRFSLVENDKVSVARIASSLFHVAQKLVKRVGLLC